MELEPGVIFAIVAGAAMLLIVGTGVAIAGGLYTLDRTVRGVRTGSPTPYNPDPKPSVREERPVVVLEPSPTTQMMAARGYVDVEPTLGERHTKVGMWIFLSSEIVFFTSLIATFLYFRLGELPKITLEELHHFNEAVHIGGVTLPFNAVILVSLNTFILLASSFAVVLALDALLDKQYGKVTLFLTGVLLLGAVFVSIQAVEWNGLFQAEVFPQTSAFGTIFFTMTGFHGLHVIGGLIWVLIFLLPRAFAGRLTRENVMDVELFGLYWHFVDIVWIVLFTVIYLLR